MAHALHKKLQDKSALIGIVGLGYVGLPLALRYSEAGYRVLGLDVDAGRAERLNAGESYIEHIRPEAIAKAVGNGFTSSSDFSRAKDADALIICVPTPLNKYREPDISYIVSAMEALVPHLRAGQVVSLESTTYPGTTEEELKPRIEAAGLCIGQDVFLVYSPEREDPGNASFTTRTIPKVCGGMTPACLDVGLALYGQVIDKVVPVSSMRAAEMTKLLENIHRAVNIGLVNEMKIVCDRMGIDIHEVIRAAATKPFGFVPYFPGPGLGGHCIPIDPFYLTWKAREFGVHTRFIELAGEVNRAMPEWVVGKVIEALNGQGKAVRGSHVLVLGVAYKKDVDDMRESPALAMMSLLAAKGATLSYADPHVPALVTGHECAFDMQATALSPQALQTADCVLIATNHSKFDYAMIRTHSKLIVDSRGVYLEPLKNVVKA